MVKAGPVEGTEVFYITVTSTDPDEAKLIANTIVQVLPVKIATIIDGSSVRTVDEAVRGKEISPGFTRDAVMGAMIGLALSLGLVFAFDVFINDTMESEDWVLSAYREEIPLLTVIPDVNAPAGKRYGRYGKYSRYGKYYEKHYYAAIEREK